MEKPQKEPNPNYLPFPSTPQSAGDEIDLRELFKALWHCKWIVVITTTIFAVGSVIYALTLPDVYKADALLAPAESSDGGSISKMAGQLGGLAALAGVNIGGGDTSQTSLAIQVMKSRQFIKSFISRHDLLVPLMAVKDWDLTSNKLVIDDEIYDSKTGSWIRTAEGLRTSQPTDQEAYEVFSKDTFNITQDEESGLYSISVKHYSPYVAQRWVNWLVEDINGAMRERVINETSKNLTYLNAQLNKTSVADMQSTFYKLIEEQTKTLMLAEAQKEFIFKVVDPAISPEIKDGPKRAIICIFGTILGAMISILFSLFYIVLKND